MQDVQAVQVGHARGNFVSSGKNADQVRQAIYGRSIGTEPASVYAVLQKLDELESAVWCVHAYVSEVATKTML